MIWPLRPGRLIYDIDFMTLRLDNSIGAGLVAFWVFLGISMVGAYAISFYFSVNTIIYYLMRREVDATEMDDVYLEQADEDFAETAPVSGAAASGTATTSPAAVGSVTTSGAGSPISTANDNTPGSAVPPGTT